MAMNQKTLNDNVHTATIERIACYTVGIAVEGTSVVATGTLIADGEERYVLTAAHVIEGVEPAKIFIWSRPAVPITERAARDVTDAEIKIWKFTGARLDFGREERVPAAYSEQADRFRNLWGTRWLHLLAVIASMHPARTSIRRSALPSRWVQLRPSTKRLSTRFTSPSAFSLSLVKTSNVSVRSIVATAKDLLRQSR
jgi:hypothetical protein